MTGQDLEPGGRRRARVAALAAGALVALTSALLAWTPLWDRDWGWHLATYERLVAERAFPWADRFSYASEGPYEPVHWVFQLAVGVLVDLVGLDGLIAYRVAMSVAIGLALHAAVRRRGAGPGSAAALVLLVQAGSAYRLLERPHMVTTLGVVLTWDLLLAARERARRGEAPRAPWALVPLFLVWANAHPGVVFGVLLAWGFLASEAARALAPAGLRVGPGPRPGAPALLRLAAAALGATLATFVNPLGPGLYPYLVGHRTMQHALDIAELRPLFQLPARLPDHVLVAGLFLLGVAAAARRPRCVDVTEALAVLAFAGLGVLVGREAPLALALLAVLLGRTLAERRPRSRAARAPSGMPDLASRGHGDGPPPAEPAPATRPRPRAARAPSGVPDLAPPGPPAPAGARPPRRRHAPWLAFALCLVPCALALGRSAARGELLRGGLQPGVYPERAAEWIATERPRGRLYNTNGVGGYLVYRLGPLGYQVYTDGRQPMFGAALVLAREFERVEARHDPQVLVIDWQHEELGPSGLPQAPSCEAAPGFRERYALVSVSRGAKVYLRRGGPNEDLIARHGYRHLAYFGTFWPGRSVRVVVPGRGAVLVAPISPPADGAALAREVERARREDPTLPYLPEGDRR